MFHSSLPCVYARLIATLLIAWLDAASPAPHVSTAVEPSGRSETSIRLQAPLLEGAPSYDGECDARPDLDRIWVFSTRGLRGGVCRAELTDPNFRVDRLDACGRVTRASAEEYVRSRDPSRPTVIYVHGNRMEHADAIGRGLFVYNQVARRCFRQGPVDWVIWSWPSEKRGILLGDVREKARRTDVEGLYLGSLLRVHTENGQPTTLIGYSFGGRIVSGALHALAGGDLRGRSLPGEGTVGAGFTAGMIAPAMENDWMSAGGYHRFATRNLEQLTVLYNRRDAVLKNYWRLDRIRNADALGYTGPTSFAPRVDGSRLPVRSRDCGSVVGFHHDELSYYDRECGGGSEMSALLRIVNSERLVSLEPDHDDES